MLSYSELSNPTDEKVEEILKAGLKHFTEQGFRKTSVSEICADAGLSKPTFYKYFDSKETLYFGTIIYQSKKVYQEYVKKSRDMESAAERLSLYLELTEEYLRKGPLVAEMLRRNPELGKAWSSHPLNPESYLHSVDLVEDIITHGVAQGEFKTTDTRRAAHVIALATVLFAVFEPELETRFRETSADFLTDLLKHGITK